MTKEASFSDKYLYMAYCTLLLSPGENDAICSVVTIAIFLPLPEVAAANTLLTSPIYGNPLGGAPFDDGTRVVFPHIARLHSILFCYGDWIFGIQLVYILEDNKTIVAPPHGKVNENCSIIIIVKILKVWQT